MKRYFANTVIALLLLVVALCWSRPASAEELYRESSEVNKMMTKLGRGATNILTGWVEIPKQIANSIRETDPVSGTVVGIVRGVGWTFARTTTGVYEVITFPFPTPPDYAPILYPEFIFKSMWGEPIPIISDPRNNWNQPKIKPYTENLSDDY